MALLPLAIAAAACSALTLYVEGSCPDELYLALRARARRPSLLLDLKFVDVLLALCTELDLNEAFNCTLEPFLLKVEEKPWLLPPPSPPKEILSGAASKALPPLG